MIPRYLGNNIPASHIVRSTQSKETPINIERTKDLWLLGRVFTRKTRSGNNAKVVFPVLLELQVVVGREAVNSRKFKSVCCCEEGEGGEGGLSRSHLQTGGPCLFLLARLTSSIRKTEIRDTDTSWLRRLRYQFWSNVYITVETLERRGEDQDNSQGQGCKMNYIFTMIIMLPSVAAKKRPIHLKIVNNQKQLRSVLSHPCYSSLSLYACKMQSVTS